MAQPNISASLDAIYQPIKVWTMRAVALSFLVLLLSIALNALGFDLPLVRSLELTQNVGIGLAGAGFLLKQL